MKKILLTALLVFSTVIGMPTMAQGIYTNNTSKTITGADTITYSSIGSNVRAFQYTYTETSGTTAGLVYLQGTINGTWVDLDSLSLSDVGTAQTKTVTIAPTAGTSYKSYRWVNTNTSSATGAVLATYIRRPDEKTGSGSSGLATTTTSKTITAADTITFTSVGSNVRGFQYTQTKTSGTAAGTVVFQGTVNGTAWVQITTLSISNVTTAQTKVVTVAPTDGTVYKSYRWITPNSSSATCSIVASYIRRPDE